VSNRVFRSVLTGVSLCLTLLASAAPGTVVPGRALADVTALVAIGPRVAGTNGSALARQYIRKQVLEAGYEVETHPVIYNRTRIGVDRDSFLRVGGRVVPGVSPAMSKDARVVAPLVVVNAPEWRESYDLAGIKGAIALVERGRRQDWEVVSYAQEAGARGVVLVNNPAWALARGLSGYRPDLPVEPFFVAPTTTIPVLALPEDAALPLREIAGRERVTAVLQVDVGTPGVIGENVVGHLAGVVGPRVIVGAHYDTVAGSPGANDNASGVAAMLEIARALAGTPLAKDVWFAAFDAEEDGMVGSAALLGRLNFETLRGLQAVIVLDVVGLGPMEHVSADAHGPLARYLSLAKTSLLPFSLPQGVLSDHKPFADIGVPTMLLWGSIDLVSGGMYPTYHTALDVSVDERLLAEAAEGAIAVIEQVLAGE
jgi:aminopeptidase YwaD